MTQILVIGGAGFIGAHLVRACLARGDGVTVVLRPSTDIWRLADVAARLRVLRVGLTRPKAIWAAVEMAAPDVVFHLATRTRRPPQPDLSDVIGGVEEDLLGLLNVAAACARLRLPPRVFVRAGTIAEYGGGPAAGVETQRETPLNAYGAVAASGSQMLKMLTPRLPFATVTARLGLTYGEGQDRGFLVPDLIETCLESRAFVLRNPGIRRDLIHVSDVVAGLLLVSERIRAGGHIINLSTGLAPTAGETADLIVQATRADPSLIQRGGGGGDAPDLFADPAVAEQLLDWKSTVGLSDGIARTVHWMQRARQKNERTA